MSKVMVGGGEEGSGEIEITCWEDHPATWDRTKARINTTLTYFDYKKDKWVTEDGLYAEKDIKDIVIHMNNGLMVKAIITTNDDIEHHFNLKSIKMDIWDRPYNSIMKERLNEKRQINE